MTPVLQRVEESWIVGDVGINDNDLILHNINSPEEWRWIDSRS
jgi:hypothetical protein